MKQNTLLKFITLLTVMVIFAISFTEFCGESHGFEVSGASHGAETCKGPGAVDKGGHCPSDENTLPDHCDSSCNCPCHAPLTWQPVLASCAPHISSLVFSEPFKAIPEVYLSKFVPPQLNA